MAKLKKELQKQNLNKAKVYVEDTDPTSKYFQIRELPEVFHAGKNGFLLVGSKNLLNTTDLLIEILDVNGNPIFQQPIARYAEGQARVVSIEIYEDTPPGPAQITILGVLATTADGKPVPSEWVGKYNVRWQQTIPVDPLRPNTTKIRTYKKPTLNVTELLSPFRKALTGSRVNIYGGLTTAKGESSFRSADEAFPPTYTITISSASLSQSMVGGSFTSSWGGSTNPGSASYDADASFSGSYSASITEVYDDQTFVVDPPLRNFAKTIYQPFYTTNYTISFQDRPSFTNTELTRSFAQVFLSDLKTFTGDIQRAKIFVKSLDSEGAYEQIYDAQIEESNLTETSSAILGVAAEMGDIYSQSVINEFWRAGFIRGPTVYDSGSSQLNKYPSIDPYSSSANYTLLRNTSQLIDSLWCPIFESSPAAAPIGYGQLTSSAPTYFFEIDEDFIFNDDLEYTLYGDVLCELSGSPSGGYSTARLDVYLSGSAFPNITSSLGQLLTTFTHKSTTPVWTDNPTQVIVRPYRNFELNFIPPRSGSARLFFAPAGGTWYLSNIKLISSIERGFNPDEAKYLVPISGKRFETLQFKAQLFDPSNNVFPVDIISDEVYFDGGNVFLRGGDNRIEGSLTVAPSGSGVTITSRGWYSASVYQTGESAIYLGEGEFYSSSTPFFVGQSGSNNDPFFSISDKLIGYNDPATGEFQLVLSGSMKVISGTLEVDRLSDITGNLGTVVAGRVQNAPHGSTAGIQLGGTEYSSSLVPTSWNAYLNLAATGSQPVLYVRPESGSAALVTITADGATFFGSSDAEAAVVGESGRFDNLLAESIKLQPPTASDWTGSRIEMLIGDTIDPGGDLFYVYDNDNNIIFSIDRYYVTSIEGDTGSINLTATSSTNWGTTASIQYIGTATSGSEHTDISLAGAGIDAYDDLYTVRWGMTLDNTAVTCEPDAQSDITLTARLQYQKDGSGAYKTLVTKQLSETITPGAGSNQNSRFSSIVTVAGTLTTIDFRLAITKIRLDSGEVNGVSRGYGYGNTDTGVTWTYDAGGGGGGGGGYVTKERFNPRFYGGVSASTAIPHYKMVPITNSVSLPPNTSGSEGEFIFISGSGPYYHDGTQWQAYGSGSGGSVIGTGTANTIAKWSATTNLTDSSITDDGSKITFTIESTGSNGALLGGVLLDDDDITLENIANLQAKNAAGSIWPIATVTADDDLYFGATNDAGFDDIIFRIAAAQTFLWRFGGANSMSLDATSLKIGQIDEFVAGSGVTVDGVELKDGSASYAISASHAEAADSADLATDAVTAQTASYALAIAPEAFNDPRSIKTVTDLFYSIVEETDFTILVDTSAGNRNTKLPALDDTSFGRVYNIVKATSDANVAYIIANSATDSIIGSATKSLADQYQSLTIQASGTIWWVI